VRDSALHIPILQKSTQESTHSPRSAQEKATRRGSKRERRVFDTTQSHHTGEYASMYTQPSQHPHLSDVTTAPHVTPMGPSSSRRIFPSNHTRSASFTRRSWNTRRHSCTHSRRKSLASAIWVQWGVHSAHTQAHTRRSKGQTPHTYAHNGLS
jgi:hypothetical protein